MPLSYNNLSTWQQTAFAAALIERMLPNYKMFSEATEFGDSKVLRNQLDLVWQRLDKRQKVKINYDVQLEKLELQIPEPEEFDFFGVFPALDACMSVTALLQFLQLQDEESIEQVSRLSVNSVSGYVELLILDENPGIEQIDDLMIQQHPLMQWKLDTQQELFDCLIQATETVDTIKQVKKLVLEQGISNLGIEIS